MGRVKVGSGGARNRGSGRIYFGFIITQPSIPCQSRALSNIIRPQMSSLGHWKSLVLIYREKQQLILQVHASSVASSHACA